LCSLGIFHIMTELDSRESEDAIYLGKELLDFIVDNNIRNVWWLSGDFHTGSVGRIGWNTSPYRFM